MCEWLNAHLQSKAAALFSYLFAILYRDSEGTRQKEPHPTYGNQPSNIFILSTIAAIKKAKCHILLCAILH